MSTDDPRDIPGTKTLIWPTIPPQIRSSIDAVCKRLDEIRGMPQKTASWEQQLRTRIHDLIDNEVLKNPHLFGLTTEAVAAMTSQPDVRQFFEDQCLIRASYLWPLSLLIYGYDVEEVRRIAGEWMIEAADGGLSRVTGDTPSEFRSNAVRDEDDLLTGWFRQLLGLPGLTGRRQLSVDSPMAEAVVPTVKGPIRIAAAASPVVTGSTGLAVTIRVPRASGPQSLDDFAAAGAMSPGVARFLKATVQARLNTLICGDTGMGKTTLMRSLAAEIPAHEPIVVIEDNPELYLDHKRRDGTPYHKLVIPLGTVAGRTAGADAVTTMSELAAHALRHRASRILLGEGRGAEMVDVLSAMTSGSDGSMVTIHARRAEDGPARAALLASFSPIFQASAHGAQSLVNQAIYLCVHLGWVTTTTGRGRGIDGIIAYTAQGEATVVYGLDELGTLRRTSVLAELPRRVAEPLTSFLEDIPEA